MTGVIHLENMSNAH